MSANGLPIGIQLAARYADEATLIRVASQLEEVMPWGWAASEGVGGGPVKGRTRLGAVAARQRSSGSRNDAGRSLAPCKTRHASTSWALSTKKTRYGNLPVDR